MALPFDSDTQWPPRERTDILAEQNDAARRWRGRHFSEPVSAGRNLPIAADLAQTSADLLFGEGVEVSAGNQGEQELIDELLVEAGVHNRLLEAGEIAAAMGGVYLRPVWDEDDVILTVVRPNYVIPRFRWGRLQSCVIWRAEEDDGAVWRHLEYHSGNTIEHTLWRGSESQLGAKMDLNRHPMTQGLRNIIRTPGLVVAYAPNVLPNRWRPNSPEGRHDWQGAEDQLADANDIWSSWMRDIRLAKSRLIVPEDFLAISNPPPGAPIGQLYFDHDREAFVAMAMDEDSDRKIVAQQFAIRFEEHERSLMSTLERIVAHAGLAPQSFGIRIEGRAESGTALRVREGTTFRTIGKKQRYFAPAVKHVLQLMVGARNSGTAITMATPPELSITFPDIAVDDPLETARTIQLLDAAKAISQETKVRMATGLEGDALQAEVDAINEEREANMPDFGAIEPATEEEESE